MAALLRRSPILTLDQLRDLVAQGDVDTVLTAFPDFYGRLVGKRIVGRYFCDEVLNEGMHCCNYLLTADMEMDPVPGYRFASWEQGYGDFHLVPDLSTLIVASWLEKTALVLCDVAPTRAHTERAPGAPAGSKSTEYVSVAPRSLLRRQVDAARELGFTSFAASENEPSGVASRLPRGVVA